MTQADTASAVGRSLDLKSTNRGQGPATKMTDPLPDGWTSFCSRRDKSTSAAVHWYATAPYGITEAHQSAGLLPTVCAETWPALHEKVREQVDLHARLTGRTQ